MRNQAGAHRGVAAAIALLALSCQALGGRLQVVAVTGESVADGVGVITHVVAAALSDTGAVAIHAGMSDSGDRANARSAIFLADGDAVRVVALEGQERPGGEAPFGRVSLAGISNSGQTVFQNTLTSPSDSRGLIGGVYRDDAGVLTAIATLGDSLSAGDEVVVSTGRGAQQTPNTYGQVLLRASIGSPPTSLEEARLLRAALLRAGEGPPNVISQSGQAAPNGDGTFFRFDSTSDLNDAGQVAFTATLDNAGPDFSRTVGLFVGDGQTTTAIARIGDLTPDGSDTMSIIFPPRLNNTGQVAFEARLNDSGAFAGHEAGIFLADGASTSLVAKTGEPLPDGSGEFGRLTGPELNDAGQIAFGTSESESFVYTSLFLGDAESLFHIAQAGDAAPGGGEFKQFGKPTLNNAGQLAFLARLDIAEIPDPRRGGLYFYDETLGLVEVARRGDPLLGSSIAWIEFSEELGRSDRSHRAFNSRGQIVFEFELLDGRQGIAVWTIPEPSSLAIAALLAIGAARPRR